MTEQKPTALVMAASRLGVEDPVAKLQNKSHKCLVEIDGVAMLERVVGALIDSGRYGRILISIESPDPVRSVPRLAQWMDEGIVSVATSRGNLADSVLAAVAETPDVLPMIVTTGDNALHTADIVRDFADAVGRSSCDAILGFTDAESVLKEFPTPGLAFHRVKDGGWSACNLYGLKTERALKAVKIFEGGGQFGKRHMRILKAFGVMPFLLYKLKASTMNGLIQRIGRNLGITAEMVNLPYGYGPIDVDNPTSFALAEAELQRRRNAA